MNHCQFEGRISGIPQERELPSGDVIVAFRLVVPRSEGTRVDTIDCAVVTPKLRKTLARLQSGSTVEVTGALRRRFWRSPGGVASRYELEVSSVRRLR